MVQGTMLTTADGTEIVRYFGTRREVIVLKSAEVLGKSCFESCPHIERVVFETGSQLRRICRSALSDCAFLTSIAIPATVNVIEESAFRSCCGLEECLMEQSALLAEIGKLAFAGCHALRSFQIPRSVEEIGEECFDECRPLHRLTFGSSASLMKILGGRPLDEGLDSIGFKEISSLLRIEVEDGGVDLEFPGWISVGDGGSTLVLAQSDK
jgi:hypothetical protein